MRQLEIEVAELDSREDLSGTLRAVAERISPDSCRASAERRSPGGAARWPRGAEDEEAAWNFHRGSGGDAT